MKLARSKSRARMQIARGIQRCEKKLHVMEGEISKKRIAMRDNIKFFHSKTIAYCNGVADNAKKMIQKSIENERRRCEHFNSTYEKSIHDLEKKIADLKAIISDNNEEVVELEGNVDAIYNDNILQCIPEPISPMSNVLNDPKNNVSFEANYSDNSPQHNIPDYIEVKDAMLEIFN
jgi:esterase/lipase